MEGFLQQLLRQPRPLLNTVAVPRVLDLLWSRLGGLNGKFFEGGWGNLGIVNLQEDLAVIQQWPPQDMQVGLCACVCVGGRAFSCSGPLRTCRLVWWGGVWWEGEGCATISVKNRGGGRGGVHPAVAPSCRLVLGEGVCTQ